MPRKVVHALWPPTIRYRLSSFLPPSSWLSDSLLNSLPLLSFSLFLSLSLSFFLSLSSSLFLPLSLSFSLSLSVSLCLCLCLSLSLSPAIPSLPRDFALLQAFGLRRRPLPLTGLWQQRSLLSPPSLPPWGLRPPASLRRRPSPLTGLSGSTVLRDLRNQSKEIYYRFNAKPLRKVCFWLHSYLPYGDQLINTVFNCNLFRRRVCGGYVCMCLLLPL